MEGFVGWVIWLFVHLLMIVSFRSRLVVLLNWAWDYFLYDRPIRLIAR
jgi:NADH dehydrogenase